MISSKEKHSGEENPHYPSQEVQSSSMDISTMPEQLDEDSTEIEPHLHHLFYNSFLLLQKKNAKKKNEVDEKDIPMMLQSLGLNPLERQIEELILEARKTETSQTTKGYLDYQNLEHTLAKILVTRKNDFARHSRDTILCALRVITPNEEECLEPSYFKKLMMAKGACFSEEEADKMIAKLLDKGTGKIWHDDFAEMLSNDGLNLLQSYRSTSTS